MSTETPVVKEPVTPAQPSDGKQGVEEVPPNPAPGSKTEGELLLASLKEEREKRGELTKELETLKETLRIYQTSPSQGATSEEAKKLEGQIKNLTGELLKIQDKSSKEELVRAYPMLADKMHDLEEFMKLPENKGMGLQAAAKVFLTENGLLETRRSGLENTNGGTRTPKSTSMTIEEIEHLRKNDYRKYIELLRSGQIKLG